MRCSYCRRRIKTGEEGEQKVKIYIDGGRRNNISIGMTSKEYCCCSYECRLKMFDRVVKAMSKEELQREQSEGMDDVAETIEKKKPSKITVSDVALFISILALTLQLFCHVILPRVI